MRRTERQLQGLPVDLKFEEVYGRSYRGELSQGEASAPFYPGKHDLCRSGPSGVGGTATRPRGRKVSTTGAWAGEQQASAKRQVVGVDEVLL